MLWKRLTRYTALAMFPSPPPSPGGCTLHSVALGETLAQ